MKLRKVEYMKMKVKIVARMTAESRRSYTKLKALSRTLYNSYATMMGLIKSVKNG